MLWPDSKPGLCRSLLSEKLSKFEAEQEQLFNAVKLDHQNFIENFSEHKETLARIRKDIRGLVEKVVLFKSFENKMPWVRLGIEN